MKHAFGTSLILLALTACEQEPESAPGFASETLTTSEADGVQTVVLDLGSGPATETEVTISITGTAGLEGDYVIVPDGYQELLPNGLTKVTSLDQTLITGSSAQFTIHAGQTSLPISIRLIDDIQVEPPQETIRFTLESPSVDNLTILNQSVELRIQDNDIPQTNSFQIDLSWELESGGSINGCNFDLYLATDVIFSGNSLSHYELVPAYASAQTSGFETIWLDHSLPEGSYYVLIKFLTGNSTARVKLVLSQGSAYDVASGVVRSTQIGELFLYGPISKTADGFLIDQ